MKKLAKVVVAILMLVSVASASAYTNNTVKGNYSLLMPGNGAVPLIGLLQFDGDNDVTLTYTQTGPISGTLSGTYIVDSNGTGTITFSSENPAITFSFVICSVVGGNAKILNVLDTNGVTGSGTATHQ